jgi:predicted amidophosphoribosyltransferase
MAWSATGTGPRAQFGFGPDLRGGRAGRRERAGTRRCAACGQATAGRPCTNEWCHRSDRAWSVVYNVGLYEGQLRQAIVGYKYRDQVERAGPLAGLLAGFLQAHQPWFEEYDLLAAVPGFVGPGARRAWSPVGRLVSELGRYLGAGWDIRPDALRKTVETPPMIGRSRWERLRIAEAELRPALAVGPVDLCGARVLVVDDVFTEGSTLREVARRLLLAGAEEVAGLVLARLPWAGEPRPGRR